jgi:hypothetical protein
MLATLSDLFFFPENGNNALTRLHCIMYQKYYLRAKYLLWKTSTVDVAYCVHSLPVHQLHDCH